MLLESGLIYWGWGRVRPMTVLCLQHWRRNIDISWGCKTQGEWHYTCLALIPFTPLAFHVCRVTGSNDRAWASFWEDSMISILLSSARRLITAVEPLSSVWYECVEQRWTEYRSLQNQVGTAYGLERTPSKYLHVQWVNHLLTNMSE